MATGQNQPLPWPEFTRLYMYRVGQKNRTIFERW